MTTPTTTTKPATRTASKSRATRAANVSARAATAPTTPASAPATDTRPTNVVGGSGRSATGDNSNGRPLRSISASKPAPARAASASKPAASKPAGKSASKPATPRATASAGAAAPVRTPAKRAAAQTGPRPSFVVASALAAAGAKLAQDSKRWERAGIDPKLAQTLLCKWLSYIPSCEWDVNALGHRTGAGGRARTDVPPAS